MARTSLTAALTQFVTGAPPVQLKSRRKALVADTIRASAKIDTVGNRERSNNGVDTSRTSKPWQQLAWTYYDAVGEVRYASGFIGACLSRCALTVGIKDSKGNIGPCFDENGEPLKDANDNILPGLERAVEARELI